MVSARGLGFRLRSRDILAAVDFALPRGAFLAVVGENGAGKTTLLDLLLGFRRRSTGPRTGCAPAQAPERSGETWGKCPEKARSRSGHALVASWSCTGLGQLALFGCPGAAAPRTARRRQLEHLSSVFIDMGDLISGRTAA